MPSAMLHSCRVLFVPFSKHGHRTSSVTKAFKSRHTWDTEIKFLCIAVASRQFCSFPTVLYPIAMIGFPACIRKPEVVFHCHPREPWFLFKLLSPSGVWTFLSTVGHTLILPPVQEEIYVSNAVMAHQIGEYIICRWHHWRTSVSYW